MQSRTILLLIMIIIIKLVDSVKKLEKIVLVSEALRTQLVTSSIPSAGFHIETALAVPTLNKIDEQLHSPSVS